MTAGESFGTETEKMRIFDLKIIEVARELNLYSRTVVQFLKAPKNDWFQTLFLKNPKNQNFRKFFDEVVYKRK